MLISFTLLLICVVLALDAGRLYFERQQTKRIADVVALEIAARTDLFDGRDLSLPMLQSIANSSALRNGMTADDGNSVVAQQGAVTVVNGQREFALSTQGIQDAVRVEITRTVAGSIIPNLAAALPGLAIDPDVTIRAVSVAQRPLYAAISAGTSLLSLSAQDAGLMAPLLDALLGTGVDLTLLGYQGLADANISLLDLAEGFAAIGVETALASPQAVLGTSVTVFQLAQASLQVLDEAGMTWEVAALQNLLENGAGELQSTTILLADILNISGDLPNRMGVMRSVFSVGDLLSAGIFAAHQQRGILLENISLDAGLVQATVNLGIVSPPFVAVGPPGCRNSREPPCAAGQWWTEARPAQLELDVTLGTRVLGLLNVELELGVSSASGQAALESVHRSAGGAYDLLLDGTTSLLAITSDIEVELLPVFGGLLNLSVYSDAGLSDQLNSVDDAVWLNWPEPVTTGLLGPGAVNGVLNSVEQSLASVDISLTVGGGLLGGLLFSTLSDLLGFAVNSVAQLTAVLTTALSSLLPDVIDPLLSPLLGGLGIGVNEMDVQVIGVHAAPAQLVL